MIFNSAERLKLYDSTMKTAENTFEKATSRNE